MSPNAEEWGLSSANEYSCAHGDQINFVDLSPKLTYGVPKGGGTHSPAGHLDKIIPDPGYGYKSKIYFKIIKY